ncbi:hypothetical protein CesoFtcFv8_027393 [Champsocephalus esox]|uniref:Uncharacterized protein n=1 Tax=Champsocephalus esox TaxID=159716 RepID=A0AAN7YBS0_9TELE|nr:hypothetical protein CesoFtcFv8_027393 [Champsocephalus esox]
MRMNSLLRGERSGLGVPGCLTEDPCCTDIDSDVSAAKRGYTSLSPKGYGRVGAALVSVFPFSPPCAIPSVVLIRGTVC